jgi:hypothetical protein
MIIINDIQYQSLLSLLGCYVVSGSRAWAIRGLPSVVVVMAQYDDHKNTERRRSSGSQIFISYVAKNSNSCTQQEVYR